MVMETSVLVDGGPRWTTKAPPAPPLCRTLSGAEVKCFYRLDFTIAQGPAVFKTAVCLQRPSAINQRDGAKVAARPACGFQSKPPPGKQYCDVAELLEELPRDQSI